MPLTKNLIKIKFAFTLTKMSQNKTVDASRQLSEIKLDEENAL